MIHEPDPQKPFTGEEMQCVMCCKRRRSAPGLITHWRAFDVRRQRYYACPDHFPPEGAPEEELSRAYDAVIARILRQMQRIHP